MAIGATADAELAERIGRAIGRELRAVGVNVDYAPVLDLATNPRNPALGIRSFGDQPAEVGRLASAWLRGLQSEGVAGAGKHFPGAGEAAQDTHLELAVIDRSVADLGAGELAPFRAAISAGIRMMMSGHFAIPALSGSRSLPATLSRRVMGEVLRAELGFEGVTISDALDMQALPQDATQAVDIVAALGAVDLLLATPRRPAQRRIESAIRRAAIVGLVDPVAAAAASKRVRALQSWVAGFEQPPLDAVGSADHAALARELARRSLTLVRDDGSLPLRLDSDARILAVMPEPKDLTPADTSSFVQPGLAAALRTQHPHVDEIVTSQPPTPAEIAAVVERAGTYDLVVLGTINASFDRSQADLANTLIERAPRLVTVALRAPWDLRAYPGARTHVCTYSILPESLEALAAALFGRSSGTDGFPGRLPVAGIA
jgi:beta-N-acetylhexosaminidase